MSHVQLQVKPRRVRCDASCEPPPFRFEAALGPRMARSARARIAMLPVRTVWLALAVVGRAIDAAFFVTVLTVWCGLHLVLWSYAFDMGPAANCFGLPCPPYVAHRVLIACGVLGVVTFLGSRILQRFQHRATSAVLLVLVTFDLAALLVLGIGSI